MLKEGIVDERPETSLGGTAIGINFTSTPNPRLNN